MKYGCEKLNLDPALFSYLGMMFSIVSLAPVPDYMHNILLLQKFSDPRWQLMGFSTCYQKIFHFGISKTVNQRRKLFEKQQRQGGLSLTFPSPFPLKHVLRSSFVSNPLYTWRKGTPWSPKTKGHWEESTWTGRAVSLSLQHLAHILSPIMYFHNFPLFNKPSIKTQVKPFCRVFTSLWRFICHVKLKEMCMLFSY